MHTVSQLARFGLFDARVPRYTSYPTATQFSSGTGPHDMSRWLAAIPARSDISLYLHVPFCRRLCWFCACRTQGTSGEGPVVAYASTITEELRLISRCLPRGVRLTRLHWGGGTPTMMPPATITAVARAIADTLPFASGAEFSVEIDPNEIDEARLDALVAAGMNRVSLGVQDFDPLIQAAIGRDQTYDATKRAADMARARGIASLNADILYGLPHQTPARIADSVQRLLSLSPDRIALYGYAHVPWMARRQAMIPADAIPPAEKRLRLFETARQILIRDGYREIGIDHFARPGDGLEVAARTGRLRRNFQGYTDDTSPVLVGIGASAISRFPQGYAQNAARTADHVRAIRAGHFSTGRGHAFRGDDLLRGRIIEALMCDFRVSRAELIRNDGAAAAAVDAILRRTGELFKGMAVLTADGLSIPEHARPLTRLIARSVDAYDPAAAGHSPAV